ncbi:MAG: hypothetical protein ACRBN8_27740 [Nannocystales bacterium]
MLRPTVLAVVCVWVGGCATIQLDARPTAIELAVAEDEDLGAPGPTAEERQAARDAQAQAALDDPKATHIDFDGEEANDAPVEMVTIPPDRTPSHSLIQDITMGPG